MTYTMYGLLLLSSLLGLSGLGLYMVFQRDPKDMYMGLNFPRLLYRF